MANGKRLIDANARIEEIKKAQCTGCENYGGIRCRACWVDDAIGLIDDSPSVDAVEVVHGRWIHDYNNLYGCSECGERETMSPKKLKNYCPNCGAKMDGDNDVQKGKV